jgi:thiol:disulfide interchange protein DsbA
MKTKAIASVVVTMLTACTLAGMEPVEGREYRKLASSLPGRAAPGKVEVVEFFTYQSKPCALLDPALTAWSRTLPSDVVFRRVHVAFRPASEPLQKLFITLEGMGHLDRLHPLIYQAIDRLGFRLERPETIANWVAEQGIERAAFLDRCNSFSTAAEQRRAKQLWNQAEIVGVPSVVVGGKFCVAEPGTNDHGPWLRTLDALIVKAREER